MNHALTHFYQEVKLSLSILACSNLLFYMLLLQSPIPIVKQSSSTLERANILVKYLYLNLPKILIQNFIAIQTRAN
jgi:hypothetical protein